MLNRDQLVDLTQGKEADPLDRSIDVQVSRLRHRLGDDPREPRLIKTVRGEGYVLAVAVKAARLMAPVAALALRPPDAGARERPDLAQLLSAAINLRERDSLLLRASGMQPAQRIADIVKLLDSAEPAERNAHRRHFQRAAAGGFAGVGPHCPTAPDDDGRSARRDVLRGVAVLRSATSAPCASRCAARRADPVDAAAGAPVGRAVPQHEMMDGRPMGPGAMHRLAPGGGISFLTQVRLEDGHLGDLRHADHAAKRRTCRGGCC